MYPLAVSTSLMLFAYFRIVHPGKGTYWLGAYFIGRMIQ